MARIRTIKPEFFTSEDIVELSPIARLFYISLWCEADREGRLIWKPKTLKLRYFPGDNCDILKLANELLSIGLIEIYEVEGKEYAEILSFKVHQAINNREADSILPPKTTRKPRVDNASDTRESGVKAEGKGKEGKGREGKELMLEQETPSNRMTLISQATEVLNFMNEKLQRNYLAKNPKGQPTTNSTLIMDRLREGYTVQNMRTVIIRKWRDWGQDDKMSKYLRPETLFAKKHFSTYLGECVAEVPQFPQAVNNG